MEESGSEICSHLHNSSSGVLRGSVADLLLSYVQESIKVLAQVEPQLGILFHLSGVTLRANCKNARA